MAFRVQITEEAEREANSILEWLLSQHAGETAIRWFLRLEEAISSLTSIPQRCALAPENAAFPYQVRQLLFGRKPHVYRILFTVENEAVYILHIRHGRRRPISEE